MPLVLLRLTWAYLEHHEGSGWTGNGITQMEWGHAQAGCVLGTVLTALLWRDCSGLMLCSNYKGIWEASQSTLLWIRTSLVVRHISYLHSYDSLLRKGMGMWKIHTAAVKWPSLNETYLFFYDWRANVATVFFQFWYYIILPYSIIHICQYNHIVNSCISSHNIASMTHCSSSPFGQRKGYEFTTTPPSITPP